MAPVEAFLIGAAGVAGIAFAVVAIQALVWATRQTVQVTRRYRQACHPNFSQGQPVGWRSTRANRLKWAVWAALKYPRIYH